MKTTWKTRTAVAFTAAGVLTVGWATTVQAAPTPSPVPTPAATTATADATLTDTLTHMREEERLARDLYTALGDKHGQVAPFVNVARSEQAHFDAMGALLTRYALTDPAAGKEAGSYTEPALQALYDRLLASGSEALAKAYEAGITVEKQDIADLKAAISQTTRTDVQAVLTNLLRGSENHLAAFAAARDGKVVGARNGQGLQNGRSGASGGSQGRNWRGQGVGPAGGVGRGAQGADRPATCPLR